MKNSKTQRTKFFSLLVGVFIVSFGVLAFEISLTRIFSVLFSYHYTFLIVSIALFGLGLGGILAQIVSTRKSLNKSLSILAILSIVVSG